jgi:hypothetical protein
MEALRPASRAGLPALREARQDPKDGDVSEAVFFECERCWHRIKARKIDVRVRRCRRCWAVVKPRSTPPEAVDNLWITTGGALQQVQQPMQQVQQKGQEPVNNGSKGATTCATNSAASPASYGTDATSLQQVQQSVQQAVQQVQQILQQVQQLAQLVQQAMQQVQQLLQQVQQVVQQLQQPVQQVQQLGDEVREICPPSSLSDSPSIPRVSTISVREGVEDEGDTEGGEGTAADLDLDADVSGNGVSKSVDPASESEPLLLKPPEVKRLLKDPELEDCIRRTRHVKLCLTPASKGFWDRLLEIFEPSEAVYVLDEVEKADLWLEANPGKRPKTERGMRQFIMNWIKKAESLGLRELAYREAIQRNNAKRR